MTGHAPESGHASVSEHPSSDNPREVMMIIVECDYDGIEFRPASSSLFPFKYVVTLAVYYSEGAYIQ